MERENLMMLTHTHTDTHTHRHTQTHTCTHTEYLLKEEIN
jgi:hypothetical protein